MTRKDGEAFDAVEAGCRHRGREVVEAVELAEQLRSHGTSVLREKPPFDAAVLEGGEVVGSKRERPVGTPNVARDADTKRVFSVFRHAV